MPVTLRVQDQKKRDWLMIRSDRHFLLVRADGKMIEQRYERLLECYPKCQKEIRDQGLHVTALSREKCTHAVFEGTKAGDKLTLWLSGDIRRFTLGEDCTREALEAFFDTQQRRWDIPEEPEGPDGKLTRIIGWTLNGFSFGMLILALAGHYVPWLTLLIFAVSAALCIRWPGRFLTEEQSGNGDHRVIRVWMELSLIGPPVVMLLDVLDHAVYTQVIALLAGGAVLGLLIGSVILWRSRAYRNEGIWLLIGLMLVSSGPLAQVNQLLDFGPTTGYTLTVERTEESRHFRGGSSYYCYVTMPDGEQEQFSISWPQYQELSPGDPITVVVHDGALGLEYMTIDWNE